jgi:hypothetical protein
VSIRIYRSIISFASVEDRTVNTERARHNFASSRQIKRMLLGGVCVLALGLGMAAASSPAAAKYRLKSKSARKQTEHVSKLPFGEIPKGPLEIFVSIEQQKLHFYSDGVHIADAPVATGLPGHLTPLGVFSVIERDRYHHSNIYSNAPMPYMERITWSGVAMHEGPGVGHQASHGCIRMPGDFAARLWMLPTMGMRVIIARPELRPLDFADPHLFVHKDKPSTPVTALPPAVQTAQTVEPGTKTDAVDPPPGAPAQASPTSGQKADHVDSQADAAPASAEKPATIGDALPAAQVASQPTAPSSESTPSAESTKPDSATPDAAKPAAAAAPTTAAVTAPAPAAEVHTPDSAAAAPAAPVVTQGAEPNKATETLTAIVKDAATDATEPSEQAAPAPTETAKTTTATVATPNTTTATNPPAPAAAEPAKVTATPSADPAAAQPATTAPVKAGTSEASAPSAPAPSASPPSASLPSTPPPAEAANAAPPAVLTAPISLDDVPLPIPKPARIAKSDSTAPIAIFVSRKEGRIYVRQDFTPVFDAPVKIENPKEPIGTHVFTAMNYLPDHSTFRWTVVTLPSERPKAEVHWKYVKEANGKRKRVRVEERVAAPAQPLPTPETPQEALARIDIPQDVIDQISQLIVPGSSLIISDHGLGPETGSGTDFIVVQR